MDFGISDKINQFQQVLASQSGLAFFIIVLCSIVLWFLPAIIAAFLNRKHFKKILVACIPGGFSFIVWFALIAWAVTGKMVGKKGVKQGELPSEV